MLDAARPYLDPGEKARVAADVLKGPKTVLASLLSPIGFFMLERPRYAVLTKRRLLLVIPPARARGRSGLDAAWSREDLEVESFGTPGIWTRMVLRTPDGRVGLNFSRAWRDQAEIIHAQIARG